MPPRRILIHHQIVGKLSSRDQTGKVPALMTDLSSDLGGVRVLQSDCKSVFDAEHADDSAEAVGCAEDPSSAEAVSSSSFCSKWAVLSPIVSFFLAEHPAWKQ